MCYHNHDNIAFIHIMQKFHIDMFNYIFPNQMCQHHRRYQEEILAISGKIALM